MCDQSNTASYKIIRSTEPIMLEQIYQSLEHLRENRILYLELIRDDDAYLGVAYCGDGKHINEGFTLQYASSGEDSPRLTLRHSFTLSEIKIHVREFVNFDPTFSERITPMLAGDSEPGCSGTALLLLGFSSILFVV